MKKITLVIVSAALAGTVWLSFDNKHQQTKHTSALIETKSTVSKNVTADVLAPAKPTSFPPSFKKQGESKIQATAEALSKARGRDLISDLESFWRRCNMADDCDMLLESLSSFLAPERFYLVENYQQMKVQWQQTLGNLLFDDQTSLAARIELLKAEARKVWGQLADVMFEDEFALYDFTIQSKHLGTDAPEYVSAEDYIQNFEDLMQRWQDKAESLGLESNQAKFEQAVTLVPKTLETTQRQALVEELAKKYLTSQQREQRAAREKQILHQESQVRNYQTELDQLKSQLSQQRNTMYANLSESEWQDYYQQQISGFRRDFFSH